MTIFTNKYRLSDCRVIGVSTFAATESERQSVQPKKASANRD